MLVKFIFLLSLVLLGAVLNAQSEPELLVKTRGGHLVVGLDNWIQIEYPPGNSIKKENIKLLFQHYYSKTTKELNFTKKEEYLFIKVDSIGTLTIEVQTVDGLKSTSIPVRTLTAVGRLSRFKANTEEKIGVGELKAQRGLIASIENYDISGSCSILEYQVLHINNNNFTRRVQNVGGEFQPVARGLINQAQSGDIFIFRNIKYQCPGDEKTKRLEDMILEVK